MGSLHDFENCPFIAVATKTDAIKDDPYRKCDGQHLASFRQSKDAYNESQDEGQFK